MRNSSKIKRIIITLGISSALLIISNFNISKDHESNDVREVIYLKNSKKSGGSSEFFIHIDGSIPGNWSATTSYDWCSGDGSWGNPYIIENVTIDASFSPTGSGIYIENSKNDYFIIKNCTVYNSSNELYAAGIKLKNTNNGTLTGNNCSNNARLGILLSDFCENNTISGNTANNNSEYGIWLWGCDYNDILGNTANYNSNGINLEEGCNYNTISGNTVNKNYGDGIVLYGYFGDCINNTISGNTADNNGYSGISLYTNCNYNDISGNKATDNEWYGIYLYNSDNTNISGNSASNNGNDGIMLYDCEFNDISGNTVNNNSIGIWVQYCNNNDISGNNAYNHEYYGIGLTSSNNNYISGNTANYNNGAIYFYGNCKNNTILGNNAYSNDFGIHLNFNCSNNVISENHLYENNYGIKLSESDDNLIYNNFIVDNTKNAYDNGINNQWDNGTIGNYWSDYSGKDVNDNGIGDSPYNISGSAGSQDNYPIWWDPIVFSINTSNLYNAFSHIAPDFDITIDEGIVDTLWYTIDEGLTNFTCSKSDKINQTEWDDQDDGDFTLTFFVNDSKGYLTMNSIIIQKDTVAPIINIHSPTPDQLYGKNPPDFNISIIEGNLLSTWYIIEGITEKYYFTELIGTINQEAWENILEGEVNITIYALDRAGNIETESVIVIKNIESDMSLVTIIIAIVSTAGAIGATIITIGILRKRSLTKEVI